MSTPQDDTGLHSRGSRAIRSVFVTGARGKTGREVIRQLATVAGLEVRGGTSKPEGMEADATTQTVRFDWQDAASWPDASGGTDAIYLMRPDLPEADTLAALLIERNAGSHIVLLSEQGAGELPQDHWARRVEKAVTDGAGSWTILRPSWFQQNFLDERFYLDAVRQDRVLALPSGGAPISWVDTRDVAAVAVRALLDPAGHHGKVYTITGPEGVTLSEVARMLSSATRTTIGYADQPVTEAIEGYDPWLAGILGDLYERVRDGGFAGVSPDVEAVVGRQPTALQAFIAEHRARWSG